MNFQYHSFITCLCITPHNVHFRSRNSSPLLRNANATFRTTSNHVKSPGKGNCRAESQVQNDEKIVSIRYKVEESWAAKQGMPFSSPICSSYRHPSDKPFRTENVNLNHSDPGPSFPIGPLESGEKYGRKSQLSRFSAPPGLSQIH
jgi:hypothetical protein